MALPYKTGEGLKLKLSSNVSFYEEPNNASFREEQDFALEAISKLIENQIVREVDRSYLQCINPLTVAHRKGK